MILSIIAYLHLHIRDNAKLFSKVSSFANKNTMQNNFKRFKIFKNQHIFYVYTYSSIRRKYIQFFFPI